MNAPAPLVVKLPTDAHGDRQRFPRLWFDECAIDLGGRYIIKGALDLGQLIQIAGGYGSGKTFFTIDLVCHIAAVMPWRGHNVKAHGLIIYIAAEAGRSIARRFLAWRLHHLGDAREERLPLAILTRGPNLLNNVEVANLLAELKAISDECGQPVAAVVFDTLSRSIPGGRENAPEDMSAVIGACDAIRDEFGAAVILVHHFGKDDTKGGRGHSSLPCAVDVEIRISDHVATVEKSRDGNAGARFPFALEVVNLGEDIDGEAITSCVVRHLDAEVAERRAPRALSGVARVALQALTEAISTNGETLPGTSTIPAGVRAVTLDQWRDRFALRYGSDDEGGKRDGSAVRKAFQRAREALLGSEVVGISSPYAWLWGKGQ